MSAPTPRTYLSPRGLALLLILVTGGLVTRFVGLAAAPISYEEAVTILSVRQGLDASLSLSPVPSVGAMLLGLPAKILVSGLWTRVLPMLCGAILLVPLFQLSWLVAGPSAGLATAILAAFSPTLFWYSQHTFPLTPALFLISMVLYLVADSLQPDAGEPAAGRQIGIGVASFLTGSMMFPGPLLVLPLLPFTVSGVSLARRIRILGSGVAGFALSGLMLRRDRLSLDIFLAGIVPWDGVAPPDTAGILLNVAGGWRSGTPAAMGLLVVLGLTAAAGVWRSRREPLLAASLTLWALGIPAIGLILPATRLSPVPETWLGLGLGGVLVLGGIGLAGIGNQYARATVIAIAVFLSSLGMAKERASLAEVSPSRDRVALANKGYRRLAGHIAARLRRDDLIANTCPETTAILRYLLREENKRSARYIMTLDVDNRLWKHQFARYGYGTGDVPKSLTALPSIGQASAFTHLFPRIWFVHSYWGTAESPFYREQNEILGEWLARYYRKGDTLTFDGGIELTSYVVIDKVYPGSLTWGDRPEVLELDDSRLKAWEDHLGR